MAVPSFSQMSGLVLPLPSLVLSAVPSPCGQALAPEASGGVRIPKLPQPSGSESGSSLETRGRFGHNLLRQVCPITARRG
jgi:hypothetical protein